MNNDMNNWENKRCGVCNEKATIFIDDNRRVCQDCMGGINQHREEPYIFHTFSECWGCNIKLYNWNYKLIPFCLDCSLNPQYAEPSIRTRDCDDWSLFKCSCGSIIKNKRVCILNHEKTNKHLNYMDRFEN
jgi:hypothetical protein